MLTTTKILLISAILLLSSITIKAQRTLLFEDVDKELATRSTNYGPNKTHYVHLYLLGGQILGETADSLPINFLGSNNYGVGVRYKNKITKWWSHGLELAYNYQIFNIAQKNNKSFRGNKQYEKERLNQHQLNPAYYWRFKIGRAGNYLGNYFDIGAYGSWTFANSHVWKTKENVADAKLAKIKYKQVNYLNPLEYGAIVRIGFNKIAITGKYRLTDIIKEQPNSTPTLPRLTIGVDIKI